MVWEDWKLDWTNAGKHALGTILPLPPGRAGERMLLFLPFSFLHY